MCFLNLPLPGTKTRSNLPEIHEQNSSKDHSAPPEPSSANQLEENDQGDDDQGDGDYEGEDDEGEDDEGEDDEGEDDEGEDDEGEDDEGEDDEGEDDEGEEGKELCYVCYKKYRRVKSHIHKVCLPRSGIKF
jgi:hypothetical protein